ncbi:hypothetical protein ACQ5SO_03450 [Rhodovulum sp. DZ06]
MHRASILNWALAVVLTAAFLYWLGGEKPFRIVGLFLVSGLAVGSL